jgi:hypothetical protein
VVVTEIIAKGIVCAVASQLVFLLGGMTSATVVARTIVRTMASQLIFLLGGMTSATVVANRIIRTMAGDQLINLGRSGHSATRPCNCQQGTQ